MTSWVLGLLVLGHLAERALPQAQPVLAAASVGIRLRGEAQLLHDRRELRDGLRGTQPLVAAAAARPCRRPTPGRPSPRPWPAPAWSRRSGWSASRQAAGSAAALQGRGDRPVPDLGLPGVSRSSVSRTARPASASASRWNRAVFGCSPIRCATSRTPSGPSAARSMSSTSARLRPSGEVSSGARSCSVSISLFYISSRSRN